MKLRHVKPESIKVPETRVTSYFDSDMMAQFQESIKTLGVVEPIICVEVGQDLYLVDGKNRWREAVNNHTPTVPVAVIPGEEKDVYLKNLFLNVMRGKQKIKEMRQVVETLYKDYKMDSEAIEKGTGLTRRFIEDLLLISELPDEVVATFDKGTLEKGKALALAKLPTKDIQLRVFYEIDGRPYTVEGVEQVVLNVIGLLAKEPLVPPPPESKPPVLLDCSFCHEFYEVDALKVVRICPSCESLLRFELQKIVNATAETKGDDDKSAKH